MFVYTSGPAGFIAALYDQLGFGKIIDDLLSWDPAQCLMSPGTRIKAMVINIFCGRRPLYRINEFYTGMDTGNLFGLGITPENLWFFIVAHRHAARMKLSLQNVTVNATIKIALQLQRIKLAQI